MTTEQPILSAEEIERIFDWSLEHGEPWAERLMASHEALRARLRDAEETLNYYSAWPKEIGGRARAYFERHADPQEKP